MNHNHNNKSNSFVIFIQPQLLQINLIIYQSQNYLDYDTSIYFRGWGRVRGEETTDLSGRGRSEEKRCYAVSSKQNN
jgi:hypothetical protein